MCMYTSHPPLWKEPKLDLKDFYNSQNFAKTEEQLIESMMSYNNVFKIMTDTHSKSFVKLDCCNVGKEMHHVTVNNIITSGKC